MKEKGIFFSLFIDPSLEEVKAAKRVGADSIELNTGPYSEASSQNEKNQHLLLLEKASILAHNLGLRVFAGHGLTLDNVPAIISNIPLIEELNIGHHIISRSIFVGIEQSVKDMLKCIKS